jgi:uncharacterized protein YgfB (UPF0149 family)
MLFQISLLCPIGSSHWVILEPTMNQFRESPRYEHLCNALGQDDPAECHGLLCGLLCTDATLARDTWLQQINTEHHSDSIDLLQSLFKSTYEQLQDEDFIFQLLLPGDEDDLNFRVEALGNWCQGFLSGLGLGGMQTTEQLTAEVKDFLQDVSQIAQVGLSAEDGNEDDETAYVEIIEYMRAGVMLVNQELQRDKRRPVRARLH